MPRHDQPLTHTQFARERRQRSPFRSLAEDGKARTGRGHGGEGMQQDVEPFLPHQAPGGDHHGAVAVPRTCGPRGSRTEVVDIHRIMDRDDVPRLKAAILDQLAAHALGQRDHGSRPAVGPSGGGALRARQVATRPVAVGLPRDQERRIAQAGHAYRRDDVRT